MAAQVNVPRLRLIAGRYYWRPTPAVRALGFTNAALGRDLSKAMIEAQRLNEAVERAERGQAAAPSAGSVAAVIRDYLASDWFAEKAPATRAGYRKTLARLETAFGHVPVADIRRQDLRKLAAALRDTPREARKMVQVFSILLSHAVELGLRPDNPALRMRLRGSPRRDTVWTPDQVAAARAAATAQGRASLAIAIALAYETAQRPTDVLRLPWSALSGNTVTLRQSKTGKPIAVTLSPALASELAGLERRSPVIVICEATGRPYTETGFSHAFAKLRHRAGLPNDLLFRDLRRTALSEAGAGGATLHELQALGGHSTLTTLPRYVVPSPEAADRAGQKRGMNKKDE